MKHYTSYRAKGPIAVDGHLDEESWQLVPKSPRFEDLEEPGRPALFDTRAAVLWDDEYLYVGFWLEEPDVRATYTTRDSMICEENDVEVFIAGENSYYEFELNALGTIMERFYVWQDAYIEAGYAKAARIRSAGYSAGGYPRRTAVGTPTSARAALGFPRMGHAGFAMGSAGGRHHQ